MGCSAGPAAKLLECYDYDHVSFVGVSAGGGAVLGALLELRAQSNVLPARAVLLSPLVDAMTSRSSWLANGQTDYGDREVRRRRARRPAAAAGHVST
jgi:acetyl esterase/lipase